MRSVHSKPIQLALAEGVLGKYSPQDGFNYRTQFLDFGCGRGDDVTMLRKRGIRAEGWDPDTSRGPRRGCYFGKLGYSVMRAGGKHDVVNLGFVLNVVEDPKERALALRRAWRLTRRVMIVAVRTPSSKVTGSKYGDGIITTAGTFQKFFTTAELRKYITETLGKEPVIAAPGIAYVFRERSLESLYLALRYPRPDHGLQKARNKGKKE